MQQHCLLVETETTEEHDEKRRIAERRVIRERERDASRPKHQFVVDSPGKYEEAEELHRQTLEPREKALGVDHPDTLGSMENLKMMLRRQGKLTQ